MEITEGRFIEELRVSGTLQGIREATVVAQTQGTLEAVSFELGQAVEEGDVLAALDSSIQELNYRQAQEQYQSARLQLGATQRLHENGNASDAELARVRAQAAGAEAAMEQARESLENRTVRAPISGRVASKASAIDEGNYIQPGTRVARIVDLSELEMEVAVGQREVGFIEQGSRAVVSIPVCEQDQQGRVHAIAAGSDERSGSFPVLIRWENECAGPVKSGMTATARIRPGEESPTVLMVPTTAILEDDGEQFVYRAMEGVARRTVLQTGETLGARTAVRSGLSEGDVVIVSALSRISDGDAVRSTVIGESGGSS
jgi:membrane fusion protein (multidrug efflux system)